PGDGDPPLRRHGHDGQGDRGGPRDLPPDRAEPRAEHSRQAPPAQPGRADPLRDQQGARPAGVTSLPSSSCWTGGGRRRDAAYPWGVTTAVPSTTAAPITSDLPAAQQPSWPDRAALDQA